MLQILMLEDQAGTKVMAAMHNLRAHKLVDLPEMTTIVLKEHKAADLPETKTTLHLPELRADLATLLLHQMVAAVVQPVAVVVVVQDHQEQEEVNLNLNTQHEKIYFSFTSSYSSCYGNNICPKLCTRCVPFFANQLWKFGKV